MKLIELHILQSFPVTCLNRDDVGAPKTAYFGGCQRARVSSQCWKRAIRLAARAEALEANLNLFEGSRTRKAINDLAKILKGKMGEAEARKIASDVCEGFLKKGAGEEKGRKKGKKQKTEQAPESEEKEPLGDTSTLLYFSPGEIEKMAEAIVTAKEKGETGTKLKVAAAKAAPQAYLKDAADIAIFGRMVANEPSLTLEGAGLFSHALSTHRVDNDIDFWTAVDDHPKEEGEDAGAANMGTIEFNSACYYRYVGLNLGMLVDEKHLGHLEEAERNKVIDLFLRACVIAVPSARKNSFFGFNPPTFVLGLRRSGQPLSLVNAFEKPVRSSNGYGDISKDKMKDWWEHLRKHYSLTADVEVELPPEDVNTFIKRLV